MILYAYFIKSYHLLSLQLNNNSNINQNWKLAFLCIVLSILWFLGVFIFEGFNEASVRSNIRWSARISVIYFCLAFGASSFYGIIQNSTSVWILKNRKYLGVSFAIVHLIHLLFLVLLHCYFYKVFIHRSILELALGGLAYVFIVLMLLTSFDQVSKMISKSVWTTLHTLGGYWILIVFSNSIIGRAISGNYEYIPLAILLIIVWLVRLIALVRKRIQKAV